MKKIKLTAAFLAAAVWAAALPINAALAAGFITVSDWAYTQVSAFREAGFMPEAMENVADYTENATREQFAELVYSMMTRFDNIDDYDGTAIFSDTDNAKISTLVQLGVINGVSDTEFMPESCITREAAAAALYRAVLWCDDSGRFSSLNSTAAEGYSDYSEISDWARDAANEFCSCGIMIGSDNKFNPKDNITIEQAMLTISRACDWLPTFSDSTPDGGFPSAHNEEEYENGFTLAEYANGYYKIRKGNEILITYGGSTDTSETVFAFGVDTYRSVGLAEADDTVYVFAMTYKDMTYVYNAENQELLYSIPCTGVTRTLDDYFIAYKVITSENGRYRLYGVYAYDGAELEPIEYGIMDLAAKGYKPYTVSVSGHSSTSASSSSGGSTAFGGGRGDGSVNEYTNSDGDLVYNGTYIDSYEANGDHCAYIGPEPLIYKGETVLIPVVDFAGVMLDWSYTLDSLTAADRTVTFTKDGETVKITAGASTAVDADGNDYALAYSAMLIEESGEDDIYICYTDFAELFGYESAVWDADNKSVSFYEAGYSPVSKKDNSSSLVVTDELYEKYLNAAASAENVGSTPDNAGKNADTDDNLAYTGTEVYVIYSDGTAYKYLGVAPLIYTGGDEDGIPMISLFEFTEAIGWTCETEKTDEGYMSVRCSNGDTGFGFTENSFSALMIIDGEPYVPYTNINSFFGYTSGVWSAEDNIMIFCE